MTGSRRFLVATSLLAGGLWAGCLVVVGLWLIWVGGVGGSSGTPWVPLGVFFVAGGQFVFMVLVADRVFRGALSVGRSALEVAVAVVMVGALAGSASLVW